MAAALAGPGAAADLTADLDGPGAAAGALSPDLAGPGAAVGLAAAFEGPGAAADLTAAAFAGAGAATGALAGAFAGPFAGGSTPAFLGAGFGPATGALAGADCGARNLQIIGCQSQKVHARKRPRPSFARDALLQQVLRLAPRLEPAACGTHGSAARHACVRQPPCTNQWNALALVVYRHLFCNWCPGLKPVDKAMLGVISCVRGRPHATCTRA